MRHPTEGVLRRLLDEPAGVADADRQHVADCPQCLDELAAMREDAALVGAALATEAARTSTSTPRGGACRRRRPTAGPERPRRAPARTGRSRATPAPSRRRGRSPSRVVLAGAGTAAANDWLQIFRTEQIAPVSFSTADLVALPDLSAYGDVAVTGDADVHEVADAAAAAAETGLDVPEVTDPAARGQRRAGVPGGRRGERHVHLLGGAGRPGRGRGRGDAAAPPPGLDGSQVRLVAGPGVAQIWSSTAGVPALVVGRAVAPTAFSSGVPFETVRDYLLSLPGLPDDVAAQLRTFTADGSTLPLPVPADQVDDVVGAGGRGAGHGPRHPRPDAGRRRVGGGRRGDRRGRFAGRRRGPVGRPEPALSVAADPPPSGRRRPARRGATWSPTCRRRPPSGAPACARGTASSRPSRTCRWRWAAARWSACSVRTARARPP